MAPSRLALALQAGSLPELPQTTVVLGPALPERLAGLPQEALHVLLQSKSQTQLCESAGFDVSQSPKGPYSCAIVLAPRSKAECLGLIEQAAQLVQGGSIILDGAKTDGIESILKAIKPRADLSPAYSKAHGKCAWFTAPDPTVFSEWALREQQTPEGFRTCAGVFSADGIDPASKLLTEVLPQDLKGTVVDLGAGWGALGHHILANSPKVATLHCIEDNALALDCARANIDDPRAQFHWADARNWSTKQAVETVVTNPPFHTQRHEDLDLGRSFICSAARLLKPTGRLFLVSNAHLPYETTLEQQFDRFSVVTRTNRFKVIEAHKGRS